MYWESEDLSSSCVQAGTRPASHPTGLAGSCLFCPPSGLSGRRTRRRKVGQAGEGRPEQKVSKGREFKEMFLHMAAVNGSSQARAGWSETESQR